MGSLTLIFSVITQTFALPPGLLSAMCYAESRHRPAVINQHDGGSPSIGLCQMKVDTAKLLGFTGGVKELQDPLTNAFYAGKYLRKQLDRYNGNIPNAIGAYNAGPKGVDRCLKERGKVCSVKHVQRVMQHWAAGR